MLHTRQQAEARVERLRAKVVEVVYVNGEVRWNLVLRNGKPRTLRVER